MNLAGGAGGYEARLKLALGEMYQALTPEQRAECHTLADLEPDSPPGMSVKRHGDRILEVWWAGASLGFISQEWLETGEMPEDWPPTLYDTSEDE